MKYMLSDYDGFKVVVDAPRITSDNYYESLHSAIVSAIDVGYSNYFSISEVVKHFINYCESCGVRYSVDEVLVEGPVNNEFQNFCAEEGWWCIPERSCFVCEWELEFNPVPPNFQIGVIEYGEKPKLRRYRRMRR